MQDEATAINNKNGFTTPDDLLVDFLNWFLQAASPEVQTKYAEVFSNFRHARVGLKLALVMGELGETLEAVRKNIGPDSHIPEFTAEEAEVADAIIRLMNYATDRKLRLAEAIVAKNEYNRNRPDHSKEARAAANGKKF